MKLPNARYLLSRIVTLSVLLFFSTLLFGQKGIPSRPSPPRLMNDFAGLLSSQEQSQLEHKLVAFNDSTSTQIAVVIVKSLDGYEVNDFATRLLQTWQIGQKDKNNGILVLVKSKTQEEKGQVYISTGYGVESFVTDALSKRIVEREILPSFREDQYFQGLDKATNVLMSLVKGQFTAEQYMKKKGKKHSNFPLAAIVIIVILLLVFMKGKSNGGTHYSSGGGGSLPFWLLLGSMMGGNRSGGFGDFRSGGGDFGSDGGGGFGGFGGGSGGGGGAGGEW